MHENNEINKMKLHRMNFFTDAVLAIILTLLVLELHLPKLNDVNSPQQMFHEFAHILPHLMAFLLCFLAIAQLWVALNAFFSLVAKYDEILGILNLLMLLPVCLLPFASAIIGDYPDNPGSFVFFGLLYFISSNTLNIMSLYMWKKKMYTPLLHAETFENGLKTLWISPVIIILIIGSAFISTKLSLILFFALLVIWMWMTKYLKLTKEEE